jgi:hypothetical protein
MMDNNRMDRVEKFTVPSELELKMSRLDIRCDHLAGITGRLPKATTDSLIQQVREVITEFYAEERRRRET